jgi:hypothetical protein
VDQTPVDRAEDPFSIFKSLAGKSGRLLEYAKGSFLKVFIENVSSHWMFHRELLIIL